MSRYVKIGEMSLASTMTPGRIDGGQRCTVLSPL